LQQSELLLAINVGFFRFTMDSRNAALQAAHWPVMELAMADFL
jgi:hypothetical protein